MTYFLKKVTNLYFAYIVVLVLWFISLLINQASWVNFVLLPVGAFIGHFVWNINWLFPKKELLKILPLILLIPTVFVLTSTSGTLGKSLVIFLNLRLLLDRKVLSADNERADEGRH